MITHRPNYQERNENERHTKQIDHDSIKQNALPCEMQCCKSGLLNVSKTCRIGVVNGRWFHQQASRNSASVLLMDQHLKPWQIDRTMSRITTMTTARVTVSQIFLFRYHLLGAPSCLEPRPCKKEPKNFHHPLYFQTCRPLIENKGNFWHRYVTEWKTSRIDDETWN